MEDIDDLLVRGAMIQVPTQHITFLTRVKDLFEQKRNELNHHLAKDGFNDSIKKKIKKLSLERFKLPEV